MLCLVPAKFAKEWVFSLGWCNGIWCACDDLALTPFAVCLQTLPGAMDESELGADVTLIIICQAYQHLLATLSQKLKVPEGLVTVWAFLCRLIWFHKLNFSRVFSLFIKPSFIFPLCYFADKQFRKLNAATTSSQKNKLCQSLGKHPEQETCNHAGECLRPHNAF